MIIEKYCEQHKKEWDSFLAVAKNSHFMFYRDYMEYHSHRFCDLSLIFRDSNSKKIIAVLPANKNEDVLYSHQGLTFGGLVIDEHMRMENMILVFQTLIEYLKAQGINRVIYKCLPHIYCKFPSEEALYALFMNNAKLIRRDITSTICLDHKIRYSKGRKWGVNKAKKAGLVIENCQNIDDVWDLIGDVLQKHHDVSPTHSRDEMKILMERFPENIKIYGARAEGELLAAAVLYIDSKVVHTQYLANSDYGRDLCALDFLVDHLITVEYSSHKYFDFGISTEHGGMYLNAGLIGQKESFGARAITHDFYEMIVS